MESTNRAASSLKVPSVDFWRMYKKFLRASSVHISKSWSSMWSKLTMGSVVCGACAIRPLADLTLGRGAFFFGGMTILKMIGKMDLHGAINASTKFGLSIIIN